MLLLLAQVFLCESSPPTTQHDKGFQTGLGVYQRRDLKDMQRGEAEQRARNGGSEDPGEVWVGDRSSGATVDGMNRVVNVDW